ncbi:MAG: hypothetical protein U0T83_00795 [Bacteriovoracaceae bacterium]
MNDYNLKNFLFSFVLLSLTLSNNLFAEFKPTKLDDNSTDSAQEKKASKSPEVTRGADTLNLHSLGIGIGETFLSGDFQDSGEDSITGEIYYTYSASYSFDVMANFHYSKHKFRGQETTIKGLDAGIKSRLYEFDSFSPFVTAGLGFYRPVVKRVLNNQLVESTGKLTLGPNFGAGVDLRLNRHFIFGVILHYHDPFDVKQDYGPKVQGSYLKLLLTVMYTF